MARYVTRRRAWFDFGHDEIATETPTVMVFEAGDEVRATGILNVDGDELFSVNRRLPIGFLARHDHG